MVVSGKCDLEVPANADFVIEGSVDPTEPQRDGLFSFLRDKPTRDALHAYLGGVSKQLDCPLLLGGGVGDHVHLLARFGCAITQAGRVKELKRVSNLWLKERGRVYALAENLISFTSTFPDFTSRNGFPFFTPTMP